MLENKRLDNVHLSRWNSIDNTLKENQRVLSSISNALQCPSDGRSIVAGQRIPDDLSLSPRAAFVRGPQRNNNFENFQVIPRRNNMSEQVLRDRGFRIEISLHLPDIMNALRRILPSISTNSIRPIVPTLQPLTVQLPTNQCMLTSSYNANQVQDYFLLVALWLV